MKVRLVAAHIATCVMIGGLIAAFTPARWLAASLWVSAALFITGSVAVVEDSLSGGFENPNGSAAFPVVSAWSATWFALQSFAITVGLAVLGCYVQFW